MAARTVQIRLTVDWDFNGSFTDESAYLISVEGNTSYAPLNKSLLDGKGVVDTMTVTLNNATGRFSSMKATAPLYSYLSGGKGYHVPVVCEVTINGGSNWYRLFTGVAKIPVERTATPASIRTVTLTCRSREEELLQRRASTSMSDMLTYYQSAYSESDLIQRWLEQAGYSGVDFSLDTGMYTIPWGWLDDESPLEDIWQLAAAAGGRFYCDYNGIFCYENASHYLDSAHTTSQATLTRDNFADVELEWQDDDLFSTVTCETAPRQLGATAVVWEPDEPIVVPAGGSFTVLARFRQPVAAITAFDWKAKTAGSQNITSSVALATPTYYAQRVEFTWTNAHATQAAYLYGVKLSAVPLLGGPSQETTQEASSAFWTQRGKRVKSIRGNPYIQSRAQANSLADFLLDQCAAPRLAVTVRGVPGLPNLRLGHKVTVNDTLLMSTPVAIMLTRIAWRANGAGFTQDLAGIDITNGLYTQASYFVLGADTLSVSPKPVFY